MAGGGAWGTNSTAPQVLKQYGVQYEEYTDPDALEREAGEGDVMIVSIWNRKGTIFEGYHTFAVQKVNGELMVYNRFNNSAESTEKRQWGKLLKMDNFICRVQSAEREIGFGACRPVRVNYAIRQSCRARVRPI